MARTAVGLRRLTTRWWPTRRLGSGFDDPAGVSRIAPLESGAAWTEIPFEVNDWLEIPTAPGPTSRTPTPAATPVQ